MYFWQKRRMGLLTCWTILTINVTKIKNPGVFQLVCD